MLLASSVAQRKPVDRQLSDVFGAVRFFRLGKDGTQSTIWKVSASEFRATNTVDAAIQLILTGIKPFTDGDPQAFNWVLSIPSMVEGGFAVDLIKNGDSIRGQFGGLEENFETLDQAMIWVGRALSSDYHLKVTFIGGKPREWRLEPATANANSFNALATGEAYLFSSLKSTSTVMLRNGFMSAIGATY